ncbi:MAG: S1 RNA-binding domain-containing protein [Chloroflexi bacterium]|nr:S1 RNA-binding domain-containing protein [Chloroflexota bacterium]
MSNEGEAITASYRLADLRPKQELKGVVKKVELYGAFVDVGAGRDGLIHISQLKPERVNRVDEVVQEGQELTVWVKKVDAAATRLELTLIPPVAVEWDEITPGSVRRGKVTRIEKFGVFVDIGAERPGLVHVSEVADGYVGHPGEVVKIGQEVEVKVLNVDRKKRQINLSMKALEEAEPEPEERQESPATAMELALRQAMQGRAPRQAGRSKKRSASLQSEREEIFARTIEQHKQRERP